MGISVSAQLYGNGGDILTVLERDWRTVSMFKCREQHEAAHECEYAIREEDAQGNHYLIGENISVPDVPRSASTKVNMTALRSTFR